MIKGVPAGAITQGNVFLLPGFSVMATEARNEKGGEIFMLHIAFNLPALPVRLATYFTRQKGQVIVAIRSEIWFNGRCERLRRARIRLKQLLREM